MIRGWNIVAVDRSGSMSNMKNAPLFAINEYIENLRRQNETE